MSKGFAKVDDRRQIEVKIFVELDDGGQREGTGSSMQIGVAEMMQKVWT